MILIGSDIPAQVYILVDGGLGRAIRHKDGLTFEIPPAASYQGISIRRQVSGTQPWHRWWKMPRLMHQYEHLSYGNRDVLGSAHCLMRGLDMLIASYQRVQLRAQVLTGLSYMSRVYNIIDNPTNNAIGSRINNATRIGTELSFTIHDDWRISAGGHLLHISNGLTSYPNSGINSWSASVGIAYTWMESDDLWSSGYIPADTSYRQWHLDLQGHYGRSELSVANGPKYSNYVISAGIGFQYHHLLTALVGIDYEYKESVYFFFLRDLLPMDQARRRAQRMAIWIANDFLFRRIIFRPQVGFYTERYGPVGDDFYIKVGLHYRVPLPYCSAASIGVVLKAHSTVADHLALVVGLRI